MIEEEMVGWHHRLKGYESEHTQGDSEGQMKPGVRQSMGSQSVDTTQPLSTSSSSGGAVIRRLEPWDWP